MWECNLLVDEQYVKMEVVYFNNINVYDVPYYLI